MSGPQKLAQEIVARYSDSVDVYQHHSVNVQEHLRELVQAVTLYIYNESTSSCSHDDDDGTVGHGESKEETKIAVSSVLPLADEKKGADWREFITSREIHNHQEGLEMPDLRLASREAYEALGRRKKARLEAFLAGVSLAVADPDSALSHSINTTGKPDVATDATASRSHMGLIGLSDGLQGLAVTGKAQKRPTTSASSILHPVVNNHQRCKYQQIARGEITVRLELYIRSLYRSKAHDQDCVVFAEPQRALKARARSIVCAFVDTVDTVQAQSPILTRLLRCLTLELLAVQVLSVDLNKVIRRLVSDYVEKVSFASLAFLSSPENSAERILTPVILKYLKYLQANWKNCVADCELERMLALTLDKDLRFTFKNIEFRSIGHLLEVCQGFRHELTHIEVSPDMRVGDERVDDKQSLRQAIRDLQREVITVNGNVLPPVKSRKDLVALLSQVLNSRTLTSLPVKMKSSRKKSKSKAAPQLSESEKEYATEVSADDSMSSLASFDEATATPAGIEHRRRRNFRLSTVDFLTKRLLLAASRTGIGGDAYFIVRDLFGGDDVEVVPSHNIVAHGHPARSGSIEILVRLASVTIKCHGSFDVYPKSLVGEVEPLIQVHTTTIETISLQEVRCHDSSNEKGKRKEDEFDSDDSDEVPVMVVQERITEKTGWRSAQIRPALYEQYEEFSTPS